MRLYFLRHGLAEDGGGKPDSARALTPAGISALQQAMPRLRHLEVAPQVIYSSPLTRAHQTAEILRDALGASLEIYPGLAPGFGLAQLRAILRQHPGGDAMLVGHEPDFSLSISAVMGGGRVLMKKGGLARLDLRDPQEPYGELVWLLSPSVLRPGE